MGSLLFGDFNEEENLSITINLPKTCYYPGEFLSGTIILQVKNNKISSSFNFTNALITFTQYQQYQLYFDNILINKNDKKKLLSHYQRFKSYKNRSILIPLTLPFSIRIPKEASPTFLYDEANFIKHFLTIKFPQIKCKKTIGIIIQNRQQFLSQTGLFKAPIEKFNDIRKSFLFKNYSKIAYLFKTDKNSYAYNEIIPYEIIMNCSECELLINQLRVSITRNIYFGANDYIDSKTILFKNYKLPLDNKKGIFKISGHFLFPVLSDYFSVNPMNIYNFYNKRKLDLHDKDFRDVNLFPTCFSSLFICSYFLNFEIIFDSFFVKNEILSIPIELYTPLRIIENEDEENNNNENIININCDENKNMINNEEIPYDDNCNNNISNDENEIIFSDFNSQNEFEILNMEDFYRILSDEKKNKLIK